MDKEATLQTTISSSSPDEALMPPPPSTADDFRQFQDLVKRVADSLQIPLEEVREPQRKLLDILHSVTPSRIALPITEALLELPRTIWQTLATVILTCKRSHEKYIPSKDSQFLYSNPVLWSLM